MARTSFVQRTTEWRDARLHGIGSSEAAAAAGLSRWESPARLWAIKLGLVPERTPSIAMLVGTASEDVNAELYTKATGRTVRRVNQMRKHDGLPFMQASVDRYADDRIVELKYSDRADGYGEPGTDEIPDEPLCQVLHQMIVTGKRLADVSLIVGGREHRIYTVAYEAEAAEELIEREHALWQAVEERREPALSGPTDADDEYLLARYPRGNGTLVAADDDARELLARLRALTRNGKQIDEALAEVKTKLRDAIGENDGIVAAGIGTLKWHRWPGTETTVDVTDWKAVASAYRLLLLGESGPWHDDVAGLDAIESLHTNAVTQVTKKAGAKLGPATWDTEEEAADAVA